jgi:SAM-dependent methyltransferase
MGWTAAARRNRPNISYRQADLHEAGQPGSYDFILSVHTLHHVPDLSVALRHIKALLAPGGRLAVMDNCNANDILDKLDRLLPLLRPRLHVTPTRLPARASTRRVPASACSASCRTARRRRRARVSRTHRCSSARRDS